MEPKSKQPRASCKVCKERGVVLLQHLQATDKEGTRNVDVADLWAATKNIQLALQDDPNSMGDLPYAMFMWIHRRR